MNGNHDESSNRRPNAPENLRNDLQIIDFSRDLKNLIEQPNSIPAAPEQADRTQTDDHQSTNLIELNSTKQPNGHSSGRSNGFPGDLSGKLGTTDLFENKFDRAASVDDQWRTAAASDQTNERPSADQLSAAKTADPLKDPPTVDTRRFLSKDVDIFDFEHLNRHQKLVNLASDNDDKLNRFKDFNNFISNSTFKLPFDSKAEPAVIQTNSDNHFSSPLVADEQNSKFANLGYQEQASIGDISLSVNTSLSGFKPACVHNTSNSSNNEEIEPLLNRSTNCNLCKNQNRLQTQSSKMEAEWTAYHNSFPEDEHFNGVIKEAERSIEDGNFPIRISQGSSGSYFVRDRNNVSALFAIARDQNNGHSSAVISWFFILCDFPSCGFLSFGAQFWGSSLATPAILQVPITKSHFLSSTRW